MSLLISTSTEGAHAFESLLSEHESISFDTVTLASGQNLGAGAVLGKITTGSTASAAAYGANTGNGAMGTITVSAGAKTGAYKLTIIEPATNAGAFQVEGPDGIVIGTGNVASAFSAGGLAFTLADGSTDFVAGDGFTITVAAGSGKYAEYNPSASNGSQIAAAVLMRDTDASGGDTKCVVAARIVELKSALLVWKSGVTSDQKTAALASLASSFIIVR